MTYKIHYWTGNIDRNLIRSIRSYADDTIRTRSIIEAAARFGNDRNAIERNLGLA